MIGGKIIAIIDRSWEPLTMIVREIGYERGNITGVRCERGEPFAIGDDVWWQSGSVYWTPQDRSRRDVRVRKIGYTFGCMDANGVLR